MVPHWGVDETFTHYQMNIESHGVARISQSLSVELSSLQFNT